MRTENVWPTAACRSCSSLAHTCAHLAVATAGLSSSGYPAAPPPGAAAAAARPYGAVPPPGPAPPAPPSGLAPGFPGGPPPPSYPGAGARAQATPLLAATSRPFLASPPAAPKPECHMPSQCVCVCVCVCVCATECLPVCTATLTTLRSMLAGPLPAASAQCVLACVALANRACSSQASACKT